MAIIYLNASYVIDHDGGQDTVTVDQRQSGGLWHLLGAYRLNPDSTITLNDVADGYVIADAIQLRQVSGTEDLPLEPHYIHSDHLGVARVITNDDGEVSWAADRLPFGETTVTTDEITYNLRFPGQYYDEESELLYNYFRNYDPLTGRYIQSDPIGLDGGFSTYGYVKGNPVRFSDPKGLHEVGYPHYDSPPQGCTSADCAAFSYSHNDASPNEPFELDLSEANQCVLNCMASIGALGCYVVSGGTIALTRNTVAGAAAGGACQTVRFKSCLSDCEKALCD